MSTCCRGEDDGAALCPRPFSASRRFSSSSLQKENFSSNPRRSTSHKTLPRDRSSSPSNLPRSLSAQEPLRLLFRCCSSARPRAVVLFRLCFSYCTSSILVLLSSSSNCSLLVVSSISLDFTLALSYELESVLRLKIVNYFVMRRRWLGNPSGVLWGA
ncbi:hypothetical protein Fmac_008490 [Flemingia macrophylla]|uniref:Uncharacterized protein n=1 Tax=Flemingia macrophylla TaxID=520843 RepID=A0ABD1MZZ2_9FABA